MKILLAPDKFKGSMTALEVCHALEKGLKKSNPDAEFNFHPMADGGEGSVEILSNLLELEIQQVEVVDALGRKIKSSYFTSKDAAFIEVASASGLVLFSETERNPMLASTMGTGEMIKHAIENGSQQLFLFLGGSATNDAGTGIAHALGVRFYAESGEALFPSGGNLEKIHRIEKSTLFNFSEIKMTLLCDVKNPLFGPNGAAHVYAKQKGADETQIKKLDKGLQHYSTIIERQFGVVVGDLSGAGAAGGIGASMVGLFGAELRPGFETIAELTGLEEKIINADFVITGEGRLDIQSLQGKVIDGVARLCKKNGKPFSLVVGKDELNETSKNKIGAKYVFSIFERTKDIEEAIYNGSIYLEEIGSEMKI